jgi:outer membrane protein OmpA-like peptidoglycan-associated protein
MLLALIAATALGQQTTWKDSRGHEVKFPLGALSFADEVMSFEKGKPAAPDDASKPESLLGPPDYDKKKDANYVTLGCTGTVVVRFTDNALVDVQGPDLYVFEVGPQIEATDLAISVDGKTWLEVGRISGGTAQVDIAGKADPAESYSYVRLKDLKSGCGSKWPGADLDAVGAIGSGLQLSLDAAVLFDFGKSELKPEAKAELERVLKQLEAYPGAHVTVLGHTDSVGTAADNQKLSLARAESVKGHLEKAGLKGVRAQGFGATRPIADNGSDEGRAKNRRVELVAVP